MKRGPVFRYLLLAASGLIGLAVFYVLDVWLLGTLAAMISGNWSLPGHIPCFRLPVSILQYPPRQIRLPGTGTTPYRLP